MEAREVAPLDLDRLVLVVQLGEDRARPASSLRAVGVMGRRPPATPVARPGSQFLPELRNPARFEGATPSRVLKGSQSAPIGCTLEECRAAAPKGSENSGGAALPGFPLWRHLIRLLLKTIPLWGTGSPQKAG